MKHKLLVVCLSTLFLGSVFAQDEDQVHNNFGDSTGILKNPHWSSYYPADHIHNSAGGAPDVNPDYSSTYPNDYVHNNHGGGKPVNGYWSQMNPDDWVHNDNPGYNPNWSQMSPPTSGGKIRSVSIDMGLDVEQQLNVYPNPTTGLFTVSVLVPEFVSQAQLKLYDVAGKQVYVQTLERNRNRAVKLDISDLPNGTYVGVVEMNGQAVLQTEAILKQ